MLQFSLRQAESAYPHENDSCLLYRPQFSAKTIKIMQIIWAVQWFHVACPQTQPRDHQPTFAWGPRQQSSGSWTGKPAATEAADGGAGWCWEACSARTNMGWAAGHLTRVPHKQIPRTPWLAWIPNEIDHSKLEDPWMHACCWVPIR